MLNTNLSLGLSIYMEGDTWGVSKGLGKRQFIAPEKIAAQILFLTKRTLCFPCTFIDGKYKILDF